MITVKDYHSHTLQLQLGNIDIDTKLSWLATECVDMQWPVTSVSSMMTMLVWVDTESSMMTMVRCVDTPMLPQCYPGWLGWPQCTRGCCSPAHASTSSPLTPSTQHTAQIKYSNYSSDKVSGDCDVVTFLWVSSHYRSSVDKVYLNESWSCRKW